MVDGRTTVSTDDAALLQHTPLFGGMPIETLQRIAEKAVRRSYGRGQIIFREEDYGDALCVVVCGLVKVYRTSPMATRCCSSTLGPASVFGELPMVDGGPRSASAAAVEATTVLTVNRSRLAGSGAGVAGARRTSPAFARLHGASPHRSGRGSGVPRPQRPRRQAAAPARRGTRQRRRRRPDARSPPHPIGSGEHGRRIARRA